MPALQQVGGVEALLFSPRLLDLIETALARSQTVQDFAYVESMFIGFGRLLPRRFEPPDFVVQSRAKLLHLLSQQSGELQFGSRRSRR